MRDIMMLRDIYRSLDLRNRVVTPALREEPKGPVLCGCGNVITITDVNYTCRECRLTRVTRRA